MSRGERRNDGRTKTSRPGETPGRLVHPLCFPRRTKGSSLERWIVKRAEKLVYHYTSRIIHNDKGFSNSFVQIVLKTTTPS